MMTTLLRSHTLASCPNSRLKTPIVPGPHTSCVISTSAFTQTLSPASTRGFPAARASIFSVSVIMCCPHQISSATRDSPSASPDSLVLSWEEDNGAAPVHQDRMKESGSEEKIRGTSGGRSGVRYMVVGLKQV